MRNHILVAAVLFGLSMAQNVFAEDDLVAEPSVQNADEGLGVFRSRKFINLTLGIEQDEKLPPLPEKIDFKGDFRKIVQASYAKDLNVMRFIPKAEGFATLTIHDKRNGKIVVEYRIDVKKSKLDKVVREIRALLGDIEGINIKIVNNRVLVDGQILLPRDLARIYNVTQQFGDQARSIVTLSPLAQKKIAEFIARDINNPEIEVRTVNDNIILQGWASSEEESKRAELIAKTYLPDMVIDPAADSGLIKKRKPLGTDGVINLIQIKEAAPKPPAKMIQLVVHYVELLKDYSKSFKFQFTPGLDDGTRVTFQSGESAGGVATSITGTIYSLLPKLNWAKQHGHARVLESTSLIVEDGKKGEIKQVTDQPYPVIGKDGTQGTAFAQVGIVTAITPTLLGEKSGSINLVMNFEVSSLAGQAAGAPIVSRNQMSSTITVRDRQSAAVGGLIRNASNTGYNRPSSDIKNPIISLYASKDFVKQQSQFVVFITPVVKTSASSGAEQIKKKFRLHD
ncbi:MAG: BON domain-containing protein [Pseudobdellovibrionaceae bacterium]